jgi:tetratricopeptide (TPR) repeat protein
MLSILLAAVLACQDGELDRLMQRFQQRREKVRTEAEFRRLLAEARVDLEAFLRDNPKHKDAPRAAFQIAETYLSAQDFDRALEKLQAYLKDYPTEATPLGALRDGRDPAREGEGRGGAGTLRGVRQAVPPTTGRSSPGCTSPSRSRTSALRRAAAALKAAREDFRTRKESWGAMMQLAVVYHVQEKNAEARSGRSRRSSRTAPTRSPSRSPAAT